MSDHTDNTLNALRTSLTRVVGPAVDGADPLAQQQLALTLGHLGFLQSRLPHLAERDRFELEHTRRLAAAVRDLVRPEAAGALAGLTTQAHDVLADPRAGAGAHRALTARLAAVISEELVAADGPAAAALERAVVTGTRERVEVERAWYAPMGFDPSPSTIRPLDELLTQEVP